MQGAFVFNIDGSATLRVPLSGISEGYHTASLTVSDNLGNFSTRRIAFNLTNSGLTGKLTADDDIVTSNATITFTSNSGAEVARLIIEDINGKTIESTAGGGRAGGAAPLQRVPHQPLSRCRRPLPRARPSEERERPRCNA